MSRREPFKIRETCFHCAQSKIKCSKEKPACRRCVQRLLTCEYKVSRRIGRSPRAVEGTSTTSISPRTVCINPGSSPAISSGSPVANKSAYTYPMAPSPISPFSHSSPDDVRQATDLWDPFLSANIWDIDENLLPDISMRTDIDDMLVSAIPAKEIDSFDMNSVHDETIGGYAPVSDQRSFPIAELQDAKPSGLVDIPIATPPCCMTIILGLLWNLFANAPTACQLSVAAPAYSQAQAKQTVVLENHDLLEEINTVIHCPCSENGFVITVVALAVFELMSGYAAPTSAESYHVDGNGQRRMTEQLTPSQLHRLQHIVNALSSRLESVRLKTFLSSSVISSDARMAGHSATLMAAQTPLPPLSGPIYLQLEEDLRKRLRAVYSDNLNAYHQS
ncbi:aflatoxin regulatory protein-domain-containing protein [Aspergillus granulosus]|uniref:Aflatoxin regulatory protein-domain-containing protein n=1 Tax=Aspergillus granulosus TaxID=176169 RepID=A0ABR4H978_9EURO